MVSSGAEGLRAAPRAAAADGRERVTSGGAAGHAHSALTEVPDLPDPAIKAICSFLPIASRTHARLVCTAWRRLAGEAVTVVGFSAGQLKSQVLSDFSRKQVRLQLAKAAAAEAAAAGGSIAAQRAAAVAAAAASLTKPGTGTSSSGGPGGQEQQQEGSSSGSLRQRRGGGAAADSGSSSSAAKTPQQRPQPKSSHVLSQGDLNALGLAALSRRIAAAFPCATTAVVELSVGDYAQYAAPAPEQVASKLLLLLSACNQMARLRLSLTAVQQPAGGSVAAAAAGGAGGGVGNAAAGGPGANGPAAGAAGAGQNGAANDDSDEESDEEDVGGLGFNPEDADYCYGWLARLLQELTLQQEQQQQSQPGASSEGSGAWQYQWATQRGSSGSWQQPPAAAAQRRQLLHPVLAWQPHELQQQQQQPSQVLWAAADAAAGAAPAGAAAGSSTPTHTPPLVLEVMIQGAAFPRDAADWQQQLAPLTSLAVLLLPPERPRLLPCMLSGSTAPGSSGGLAALTQLRALQLSVDAGYHAPHLAFEWGLVPPHPEPHSLLATASSSNLVALSRLSRLTHLALHVSGAAAADVGAALMPLRRLRELLLSGSSGGPLPLPAVMGGMRELQLLVVQQQVTLHDLSLLASRCPKLKFLEVLGLADSNGALQGLLPSQVLLQPSSAVQLLSYASECADVGLLLGPAADAASKQYPGWLLQHPGSSSNSSGSGKPWTHPLLALSRAERRMLPHGIAARLARIAASAASTRQRDGSSSSRSTGLLLHWVSLTFLSEAEGVAGRVATEAARLLASLQQQQQRDASRRLPQQLFRQERSSKLVTALSVADVADALRSTKRDVDSARSSLSAVVAQVQAAQAAAARGAAPPEALPGSALAALQKLQPLQRRARLQAHLLRWWPALCAAQEQLQQAVWGLLQQRLAAAAPFHATSDAAVAAAVAAAGLSSTPALCFTSLKEPTPSTATLALLQLVAACAPLNPQHRESGPMLPLVADDMMPAGAVGDLLDHLLNAAPFHSPTDASEEQQAADLAEEAAAAAAWRLQQHRHQQHDDAGAGSSSSNAAAGGGAGGRPVVAAGSPAAAAAAGPVSPAAGDSAGSHPARGWGLPGWSAEDSLLQQQQWLLTAYSSSGPSEPAAAAAAAVAGGSVEEDAASQFLGAATAALADSSNGEEATRAAHMPPAAAGSASSSSSQLRRLVMCVSSGADLSTLLGVAPGLKGLTLTIPPSLLGARGDEEMPEDDADTTALLPPLQLWLGSADLASTVAAAAAAAAAVAGDGGGSSSSGVGSGSNSLAHPTPQQQHQQQYERWLVAVAGAGAAASFAGSFLAGSAAAATAATADAARGDAGPPTDSSTSRGAPQPAPAAGLNPNPSCCFVNLTELTLSNLTRADGPWEPAATIGDAALAAVALGCPGLKKLEVSGVLSITGAGLLLLRRLQRLALLRLEQWTNTYNKVAEQQLVLPLACLPHTLTSLSLLHVEPDTVQTPLSAIAAAVAAAGGPAAVAAAAGAAAAAAGAAGVVAALQPAAVRRAAVLVLAAAGKIDSVAAAKMLQQQQEQQEQQPAIVDTSKRSKASSSSSDSSRSSSSESDDDDSSWETDDGESAAAADGAATSAAAVDDAAAAVAGRVGTAGAAAAGGEQQAGPWPAFLGFGVGAHATKPYERVMARSHGDADDTSSHDGGGHVAHAGHHHHHHHHHEHEEGDGGELSVPLIGCRQWLPPAAIALLLLDTFVLSMSSSNGDGGVDAVAAAAEALRADTSCCSERCCLHGSSRSCISCSSDGQQQQQEEDATSSSSSSSSSSSAASLVPAPQRLVPKPCCLAPVFQGLEDFSLISHGTGFMQQPQSTGGPEAAGASSGSRGRQAIGGVHAALVAGLPHAGSTLRRLHVATPGAFADAGHKEGFLHGVLVGAHALSCGMLTSGAAALVGHAAAAGLWDRVALLHPLGNGLAALWPRGNSSGSGGGGAQQPGLLAAAPQPPAAAGGSSGNRLSASYSWLRGLGEMPALREVHLDMPLSLPGQLEALAGAVGSSSSIVTLRLHGVALSPFSTQHSLLRSLARISPAAAALLDGSSSSSSGSSWLWWGQQQQQGPSAAEPAGGEGGAPGAQPQQEQSSQCNPLQLVDISFTKQVVLPPAALTMSRLLADMREQQQKWHQLRRLEALQQQHSLLSRLLGAVQGGALAGLGGGAAAGGAGWNAAAAALAAAAPGDGNNAGAAWGAAAAALAAAAPGGGGGAGGDPMAWPPGLVEALLQGMQGDPQEQQDAAAAVAAAAAAGLPVPLEDNALPALVEAAAAFLALQAQQQEQEEDADDEEQQEQQQGALPQVLQVLGPAQLAPLLRHLIMHLEHQMHLITHHSPPPLAPRAHTHAAAATAADRALAANLAWLLRTAGVADVTVRMHGGRSASSGRGGSGVVWEEDEPSEQEDDEGEDDAAGQQPGGGGGSSWGPRARGHHSNCGSSDDGSDKDGGDEDGGDAASAQFWANVAAGFVGGEDGSSSAAAANGGSSSRSRGLSKGGLVNPRSSSISGSSVQAVLDATSLLAAAFAAWCAFGIRTTLILEPLVLMIDPVTLMPQLVSQRTGGGQDSSSAGWWGRRLRSVRAAARHGAKILHGLCLLGLKVAMVQLLLLIAAALAAQDFLQRVLGRSRVGAAAGTRGGVAGACAAVSTAVAAAAGAVLGGRDSTQQLLLPLLQDLGLPHPRAAALLARLSAALPHNPGAVLDGVLGLQESLAPAGQPAAAASDSDSDDNDGQHGEVREQLPQQEDLTGVPSEVQVLVNVGSPAGRGFVAGAALAAWPLLVAGLWVGVAEVRWLWSMGGRPLLRAAFWRW